MADLTLYNVSAEFDYLCDLVDRDVLTEQEQAELTNILANKIQNSAEEVIQFFKTNDSHIDGLKAEIAELQARKKKAEERKEYLREAITQNMKKLNLKKIETTIGNMVVPNRVDISIEVTDIDKVPEEYKKTKTEVSVDKTAIKKHFKETGEIIEGTNIIQTQGKVQFK